MECCHKFPKVFHLLWNVFSIPGCISLHLICRPLHVWLPDFRALPWGNCALLHAGNSPGLKMTSLKREIRSIHRWVTFCSMFVCQISDLCSTDLWEDMCFTVNSPGFRVTFLPFLEPLLLIVCCGCQIFFCLLHSCHVVRSQKVRSTFSEMQ